MRRSNGALVARRRQADARQGKRAPSAGPPAHRRHSPRYRAILIQTKRLVRQLSSLRGAALLDLDGQDDLAETVRPCAQPLEQFMRAARTHIVGYSERMEVSVGSVYCQNLESVEAGDKDILGNA